MYTFVSRVKTEHLFAYTPTEGYEMGFITWSFVFKLELS